MEYAGLDVYASLLVYETLKAIPDPFDPSPLTKANLAEGDVIVLLPKGGKKEVLATGTPNKRQY